MTKDQTVAIHHNHPDYSMAIIVAMILIAMMFKEWITAGSPRIWC